MLIFSIIILVMIFLLIGIIFWSLTPSNDWVCDRCHEQISYFLEHVIYLHIAEHYIQDTKKSIYKPPPDAIRYVQSIQEAYEKYITFKNYFNMKIETLCDNCKSPFECEEELLAEVDVFCDNCKVDLGVV